METLSDELPKRPQSKAARGRPKRQHKAILTVKCNNICKTMEKLPFELLYQIIDDLPVAIILDTSCKLRAPIDVDSSNPASLAETRFDQALLSHIRYQHVFQDSNTLHRVRYIWATYQKVWARMRPKRQSTRRSTYHVSLGELSGSSSTSAELPGSEHIWDVVHRGLSDLLSTMICDANLNAVEAYANEILLNRDLYSSWSKFYNKQDIYASSGYPHLMMPRRPKATLTSIDWDKLHGAERNFVNFKSTQLYRLADLLESNPEMIKLATDPSQKPRKSVQHCVMGIRYRAKKASKVRYLSGDDKGSAYLRFVQFALVPFDRDINTLLRAIGTETYIRAVSDRGENNVDGNSDPSAAQRDGLMKDLTNILAGLSHYSTKPYVEWSMPRLSRVSQTTNKGDEGKKMIFFWPPSPHFERYNNPEKISHVGFDKVASPHAEEEFEWLESYLRTCKWLKSHDLWLEEEGEKEEEEEQEAEGEEEAKQEKEAEYAQEALVLSNVTSLVIS